MTRDKIKKSDLKIIKIIKKNDFHLLTSKHVPRRKTMCRMLYEHYLADEILKYSVIIDWVWVGLFDCNKKESFTTKNL